jgi:hypothetical protein
MKQVLVLNDDENETQLCVSLVHFGFSSKVLSTHEYLHGIRKDLTQNKELIKEIIALGDTFLKRSDAHFSANGIQHPVVFHAPNNKTTSITFDEFCVFCVDYEVAHAIIESRPINIEQLGKYTQTTNKKEKL